MRTNIVIDDKLMNEALRASGLRTKRETVEEALRLLVQLGKQRQIKQYRGKLPWVGNLNQLRRSR